jgi:hypothetical protein
MTASRTDIFVGATLSRQMSAFGMSRCFGYEPHVDDGDQWNIAIDHAA